MKIDPNFIWKDIIDFNNTGGVHQYLKSGTFLTEDNLTRLYKGILNNLYLSMGAGRFNNGIQNTLTKIDKFRTGLIPPNKVLPGFTFITRPRLNLSDGNIRLNRILNTLDTKDSKTGGQNVLTMAFAMRCLLDTYFTESHAADALKSPLIDPLNPFLVPFMNCLSDISGWPDFNIETETTEGGFHNEDVTFSKGSDMLNRSGELTLGFRDMTGGVLLSMVYLWLLYMALQNKGDVLGYEDDIYAQRLNYTVSIYRFVMDPSRQYISWWAKATGCFPKNVPIGALFNFNEGEMVVEAARQFSIPFSYNKVEYQDSGIIRDFNRLMRRYVGGINVDSDVVVIPNQLDYNYLGYPYINDTDQGLKLEFRAYPSDVQDYNEGVAPIEALVSELSQIQAENLASIIARKDDEIVTYDEIDSDQTDNAR